MSLLTATLPAVLRRWFGEVQRRPPVLVGDPEGVAEENLWAFGIESDSREAFSEQELSRFLRAVAALWKEAPSRSRQADPSSWCFYAWHDEMSGQLRFSLVPGVGVKDLPFSCTVREASAEEVSRAFLGGESVIPYSELQPQIHQGDHEPRPFVLDVWVECF